MYKLTNFKLTDNMYKLKLISVMRDYLNTSLIDAKLTVNSMLTDNFEIITKSDRLIYDLSQISYFTFDYNEIIDKQNYIPTKDSVKSDADKWYENLSDIEKEYVKELAYSLVPGPACG